MPFLYPRLFLKKHTYYIRVQVPKHLIILVKKKNIVYSLHTKDYYEALYRVREESYKVDLLLRFYEKQFEKMIITTDKKIFLNDSESKLILIERWIKILKDLERYEKAIKAGKITYQDLSFYQPDRLEDFERIQIEERETTNGEIVIVEKPVVDVWDGYQDRVVSDDVVFNPSIQSMEAQLYRYIIKVLGEKAEQRKTDRQILEIFSNNPNAMPLFTVRNEELKQQDDFNQDFIGWNFLYYKFQESEQILFNMIDSIKNGTSCNIPLYFQAIIDTAKEIIRNNLITMRVEPKQVDYNKLVDDWKEYQSLRGVDAKTIETHGKMVLLVAELLKGKKIRNLLQKDIKQLEKDLLFVPTRCLVKYANKSVLDVIAETKDKDIERLSHPTVRNYVRTFGNFVNFLVGEDVVDVNPFKDYQFKFATNAKESYQPFTDDELQKIFNPKTYPLRVVENDQDAKPANFWIPLFGLFLGARIDELCQCDVSDIQNIQGVPCIEIIHENEKTQEKGKIHKKTKTKQSRILPIPQKIIDLGFLEYVENRKKAGCKKLYELKYSKGNRFSGDVGDDFAKYLDKIKIISPYKVFHSFRHTLTQTIANMKLPTIYAVELGGWSKNDGSAFSGYQNGQIPITTLKEVVDKMFFPMIDFDALKNRTVDDLELKPIRKRRRSVLGNKLPKGTKVKLK